MSDGFVDRRKSKWPITAEMHEKIKKLYATRVGMTRDVVVRAYAESIGYPRWTITRYARSKGWIQVQKKEPDWSVKELEILRRSAHRHALTIQKRLKAAGFTRSETAIVVKRKRMRFLKNKDGYSISQVAQCFGIDTHTVARWVRHGQLRAIKRGTKKTVQQGGGIHYIKDVWVRDFIIKYLPEIDIRKVDKFWFCDLLIGGSQGAGPLSVAKESVEDEPEVHTLRPELARAVGA